MIKIIRQRRKVKSSSKTKIKKFKDEHNIAKESNQEQGANLQQIMIELLKLLLRDSNI